MESGRKIDRIYEAVRKINQVYEVWASAHGLTLCELQIYYEMMRNENEAVTQRDLSTKLDAPKTSINSIVKKQIKAGHIEMNVNPKNKREKILSFTSSGRKFAKNLIQPLVQYEDEAAEMLTDEEMETAIITQVKFADILMQKFETARR